MSHHRVKDVTDEFMVEDAEPARGPGQQGAAPQQETDPHRLAQRQKQIDMGKNTLGYQRYRQAIPRDKRNRRNDPMTPDVYQVCSKRAFEGQVKKWRRQLHAWDPPEGDAEPAQRPVHAAVGHTASNPPAPAQEPLDDFEHITHADARRTSAASSPSSHRPKNGAALRPGAGNLPLKIPSAMRKRTYDETSMEAGTNENLRPQQGSGMAAAASAAPGAKLQRRSQEGQRPEAHRERRGRAAGPASEPGWADQRFQDPELDYGDSDEDADGWQHVQAGGDGLQGQYRSFYNNLAADNWDEEIQI